VSLITESSPECMVPLGSIGQPSDIEISINIDLNSPDLSKILKDITAELRRGTEKAASIAQSLEKPVAAEFDTSRYNTRPL
jgi:siroheme synthase (precorrin-2 oxidase/ferrochelatase)